jgi:hypothetical protein
MATYALMHGLWGSGWHWHAVSELMREHGHRAVAPDLPIDDPRAGSEAWSARVVEAIGDDDDGRVVVVAHSIAGLALPLVAAARPVATMVFLSAIPPQLRRSAEESMPERALTPRFSSLVSRLQVTDDGSTRWASLTDAAEALYDELPRGVALVAASHLRRQHYLAWEEVCPLSEWPGTPAVSIVCRHDQVFSPAWLREASRERLGVEAVELAGGHMPFLVRPSELVNLLLALTDKNVMA